MKKQLKKRAEIGQGLKILMMGIVLLTVIMGVSATWDITQSVTDKKDSNFNYGKIELTDYFPSILGEKIWEGEITEHTTSCSSNCESILKLTVKEGLSIYDSIKFYKLNNGQRTEKNIYSYKIELRTEHKLVQVPKYKQECSATGEFDIVNGTNEMVCKLVEDGTKDEYQDSWSEITKDYKSDGSEIIVRISGNKKATDEIDWVITTNGESLDAWASWLPSTLATGLLSYWSFDEGTGTTASNSLDATKRNLSIAGTNWLSAGKISKAYLPNGADCANPNLNFNGLDSTTFNFWINKSVEFFPGAETLMANGGCSNLGEISPYFNAGNSILTFTAQDDGSCKALASPYLTNNTWIMLTYIINSSDVYMYVNGTYNDKVALSNFAWKDANTFFFDNQVCSAAHVDDVGFDEWGIWNRTLTPTEITSLYNDYAGKNYGNLVGASITLNNPADLTSQISNSVTFNCTATPTPTATLVNISLWLNNTGWKLNATNAVLGTTNTTTFTKNLPTGNYQWSCSACDNDGDCGVASSNRTISILAAKINYINYSNTTLGSISTFVANVSAESGESITAVFNYNGVNYATSKTGNNYNMLFTNTLSNNVSGSIPFYWNITAGTSLVNSDIYTQTVSPLNITNCSQGGSIIFNFTVYDEDSLARMAGGAYNVTIEADLDISSSTGVLISNYSTKVEYTNPLLICTSATLGTNPTIIDATIRYAGNGSYISEFYNIQNFSLTSSTLSQNISLYNLLTARAQEFKITYKDSSFLPVQGAMLDLQRKYVGDGVFRTVEAPKFDSSGNTLANLVLGDVIYTLIVKKDNQILGTFDNVLAYCDNIDTGDCQINLNSYSSTIGTEDYVTQSGITFTMSYVDTTRTFQSIFNTNDGSTQTLYMNVTVWDSYGNNTVCSDMLTSSSGTLSCVVPPTFGNTTLIASLYKKGSQISLGTLTKRFFDEGSAVYGGSLVTIALLGFLTIAGIGLSGSALWILIFSLVGLITMGAMYVLSGGGWIGVGGAFMWLVIAVVVILWKINRRNG